MTLRISWRDFPPSQDSENLNNSALPPEQDSLPVFSLKITHREGEVAIAHLIVPHSAPVDSNQWACISCHEGGSWEVLFYGKPIGMPVSLDPYTKKIELLAIPQDVCEQHKTLVDILKKENPLHDYFMDPHQSHNPAEYLEATPHLFCYHRVTHEVTLSNLFEGQETLRLKDEILEEGFQVKLTDSPLSGAQIHLSCEWVQEAEGEFSLMPPIEHHFSQGIINTLTPSSLLQNWPSRGQLLGNSGYGVVRSHLSLINPNETGSLGVYPTLSPVVGEHRYARYWFQGELTLSWKYRQKRQETLIIPVLHQTQMTHCHPKPPRSLKLRLNGDNLDSIKKSEARFLDTPQALPILHHALKIAQCHLAYSARALEITLQIPLSCGLDLHLDQSIEINHPCLPGSSLSGKLIGYVLEKTVKKSVATLHVALSVGVDAHKSSEEGNLQEIHTSPEPVEGIGYPDTLSRRDFVEALSLRYGGEEQIEYLSKKLLQEEIGTEDDGKQKEGKNTRDSLPPLIPVIQMALQLKDLRSHDVLKRTLWASPVSWSAPKQIPQE